MNLIKIKKPYHIKDNRLQGMSDKYNGAYYGYDATGERSLKLTGQTIHVNQNGQDYHIPVFDKQTLYASPLITINDEGYTKHYFEEGKRICSKIGSGELHNVNDILDGISDRAERLVEEQQFGVEKSFEICMGMYSSVKTYNLNKHIIQPYQNPIHSDEPIFYYHSDHLGSASFLTDNNGNETQQLVYLPYGEDWVDLKYNTQQFETPYKFNGKEKDLESGYNYYGARYYCDWLSIWLSVDPLSDKYPHLTSYNYCANNPVMLVDPDGREIDDYFSYDGKYLGSDNAETDNVRIISKNSWNNIKTTNQDGTETVNHDVGYANSVSFSKGAKNMSKESKLNVFSYYNSTGLSLKSYDNPKDNYMGFNYKCDIDSRGKIISTALSVLVNLEISDMSNNFNNIINAFGHEQDHYDLFQELGAIEYDKQTDNLKEQRAIRKQMTLPSWKKTTIDFKEVIRNYGLSHGMFFNDFEGF